MQVVSIPIVAGTIQSIHGESHGEIKYSTVSMWTWTVIFEWKLVISYWFGRWTQLECKLSWLLSPVTSIQEWIVYGLYFVFRYSSVMRVYVRSVDCKVHSLHVLVHRTVCVSAWRTPVHTMLPQSNETENRIYSKRKPDYWKTNSHSIKYFTEMKYQFNENNSHIMLQHLTFFQQKKNRLGELCSATLAFWIEERVYRR